MNTYKKIQKNINGFNKNSIEIYDSEKNKIAMIEYSYIDSVDFILKYTDPIEYLNNFKLFNIDKNNSKKEQLKEILKFYKKENINLDEINIEDFYEKLIKKIRKDLYKEINDTRIEYSDKAVVDFVFIEKKHRNKGLLEELYKLAYLDLKEKKINLYSSICQSKDGKKIWGKLKESGFEILSEKDRFYIKNINNQDKKYRLKR